MQNLQPKLTRALAISLALIMGLVLAGCGGVAAGKADINLDIDEDLLVSGTYQMGVDLVRLEKEKSIFTSVLSESELDRRADEMVSDLQSSIPEGATVEKVKTGSEIGIMITLDKVVAEDFDIDGVPGPDIMLEKDGGVISMSMENPVSAMVLGNLGFPVDPSETVTQAQLTLAFPGDVIDAEGGRVNGNTVTYDLRTYGQNTIVVNAEAPSFPWLLVFIIIGVVLLLIIGAVVIFLLLKKKNAGQSAAPVVSGQYPYDGQTSAYPGSGPYTGQVQTQGYPGQPPQGSGSVPTYPPQGSGPMPPQGAGPVPPQPWQSPPQGSGPVPPQPPQPPQA